MTVNGDSILAFEGAVDRDIRRVEGAGRLAGGLFNVVLEGTGKVVFASHGEPVLLDAHLRRERVQVLLEGAGREELSGRLWIVKMGRIQQRDPDA